MPRKNNWNALGATAAFILLSGCVTASNPVPDNQRNTSGKFDAIWLIDVLDTPNTRQRFGNWVIPCDDMAWTLRVQVTDGVMRTVLDGTEHRANVDDSGRFELVVPTEFKVSESVQSAQTIQRGQITLFISGNLSGDAPSGTYRQGIEEFANNGCRTKAKFTRET